MPHGPVGTAGGAPTAPVGRIVSLDWVRGLFLCVSVTSVGLLAPRPALFEHAEWFGISGVDLVFPLFVTLSGCGLAFAYSNAVGWRATLRRSVVLLLCGLIYNAVVAESRDPETLRLTGPLQVYAVLVLVIGVVHLRVRTPRAWMLVTLGVASVQASLLAAWQADCPGGELLPTCNPSRLVDVAVLGRAHVYAGGVLGHDPEGIIAAVGALVTACAGTTAGHLALASKEQQPRPLTPTGLGRQRVRGCPRGRPWPARHEATVDHPVRSGGCGPRHRDSRDRPGRHGLADISAMGASAVLAGLADDRAGAQQPARLFRQPSARPAPVAAGRGAFLGGSTRPARSTYSVTHGRVSSSSCSRSGSWLPRCCIAAGSICALSFSPRSRR